MIKRNLTILIVLSALLVLCPADRPARTFSFDYVANAGSEEISGNSSHYLLITNNDLASAFQPLVDRRIGQGFSGNLITVEAIDSAYTGIDIQEKIRNCIKDHYDPCVPLFVALGGDAIEGDVQNSVVPVRYCDPLADGKPVLADSYYADTDGGSWDSDGDGIYGEVGDVTVVELVPEVYIGRIPVRTPEEARAYIDKVIRYENASTHDFASSMIMFGGWPWTENKTGAKRPEALRDHDPVSIAERHCTTRYLESIQLGWQAVPLHFFCDTKTSWDEFVCGDYDLIAKHVVERLNLANQGRGYHMMYHFAHSAAGQMGLGSEGKPGFKVKDVYLLANSIPAVVFSGGCATAYFEKANRDPCVAEAFIRNPYGGAVVYFGFARSHGGEPTTQELCKEIFQHKSVYFSVAFAHARAKVAALLVAYPRKNYIYTLLGDPAIRMLGIESGRKVQLFQPKGCEVIAIGDDMTIRWNATGTGFSPSEFVRLDYSDDGGQSLHPIPGAEQLPYDGCSFVWENCPLPAGTQYRIRVTCLSEPSVFHYSERDFTVAEVGLLTVRSYPFNELKVEGTHRNRTNYTHSVKMGDTVSLTVPENWRDLQFVGWSDSQGNILSTDLTYAFTFAEDATIIAHYDYLGPVTDYYVNDEIAEDGIAAGSDLNDGLSPKTSKRHIQSLLGDYPQIGWGAVIHISKGHYPENIALNVENNGLTLAGAGADSTVIDGGANDSCLKLEQCTIFFIKGLSFSNGYADNGGGILCDDSSPVITDCVITGNIASGNGGGICNYKADPILTNCTFTGNSARFGGGIYNNPNSNPTLERCAFIGNSASRDGGGIYNYKAIPILTNCTFTGNSANYGGGIYNNKDSNPTLERCAFIGNSARRDGGGVFSRENASPTLINCTLSGNTARRGAGLVNTGNSSAVLTNCILWGDTPDEISADHGMVAITYSDVQGGWPGETNIDTDPLFANLGEGDYHLKSQAGRWDQDIQSWVQDYVTSPCIDAGDPTSPIGFEPLPNGVIINMGAYGGTPEASMSIRSR